jgi:hypothetical protein
MIVTVLAQSSTNPTGPEFGKASPVGIVIVLILLAGTALLIFSMSKHINRLPAEFSQEHPEPDQEADEGTEHGITRRDEPDEAAAGHDSADPAETGTKARPEQSGTA